MEADVLQLLEEKIAQIEKRGHGEVVIKIKNGVVYRVLTTEDSLVFNMNGKEKEVKDDNKQR